MRGGKVFIDFEPLDNGRTVEMPRIVSWIHSPLAPGRMNAVENIDTKPKSADPSSSAGEITLEYVVLRENSAVCLTKYFSEIFPRFLQSAKRITHRKNSKPIST